MRKIIAAAFASTAVSAFMSDTTDVVYVKGANGDKVRVNQADFDADQASDKPTMTPYTGKMEPEQSVAGIALPIDAPPLAAPSAPNFGGPGVDANLDPLKNAVAPAANAANSRLVLQDGAKFFVVNNAGDKIDIDGVDPKGYKTEEGAWQAIRQLPSPGSAVSPE